MKYMFYLCFVLNATAYASQYEAELVLPQLDLTFSSSNLYPVNNRAFLYHIDNLHGRELWITDGSGSGTHMVKDIILGPEHGIPSQTFQKQDVFFEKLIFRTRSSQITYLTDGTAENTSPLSTYGFQPSNAFYSSPS